MTLDNFKIDLLLMGFSTLSPMQPAKFSCKFRRDNPTIILCVYYDSTVVVTSQELNLFTEKMTMEAFIEEVQAYDIRRV